MSDIPYHPIFELTRGKTVESIHFGAVAVADASGNLFAWYGDPNVATFLRSSAKPFQALPFFEHGGKEKYGLTDREVALVCSSHSGTDEHVATVRGIQAKAGVSESELMCGTHPAYHQATADAMHARGEAPTPNRHNCSGKHTGMLAYTKMHVPPVEGDLPYINPAHPVQKEILQAFSEMCGLQPEQVSVGIDGCSVPTFAVPLVNAATAFARLFDPRGFSPVRAQACQTITRSMMANPDMVGGPDSFDTHLMSAASGKVLCKAGAEGYQALGLPAGTLGPGSPALGIAVKISDGDLGSHSRPRGDPRGHARPAVVLEVLRQLGALTGLELEAVGEYGPSFGIQNWRKLDVGMARPIFTLERAG